MNNEVKNEPAFPDGWSLDEIEDLRRRLVDSQLSALLAGENMLRRNAIASGRFIHGACMDAANLLDAMLAQRAKGE